MDIVLALIRENRFFVIAGIILVIASAIANVGTINNINLIIASEGGFLVNQPIFIVFVLLCAFGLGVSSQMLLTQMGYRVIYQLRRRLLQQVLNTDYEHLQQIGQHKIYAAITKDIQMLQNGFIMLPFFLYAITIVLAGMAYMFYLNTWMASIVFISITLTAILSKYITSIYQTLFISDRDLEDELFSSYNQMLDGHKELLLNENRGKNLLKSIMSGPALRSLELRTVADRYVIVNIHLMSSLILVLIIAVFWMLYQFDWGLSAHHSIAVAASFALTLMFIRQPLNMAMNQIGPVILARVSLKKLRSLDLSELTEEQTSVEALHWKKLQFENVKYRYKNDTSDFSLGPINFTINQGELIFLTGHNGAGKTTLIRLILGLIQAQSGKVFVDEHYLEDEQLRSYRKGFSAVLADFHLFENLNEFDQSKRQLVEEWLSLLDLQDKVKIEKDKFSSTNLSTGQRKRLAMVSAVAEERPVMILDEWAADQDPVFRKRFYFELLPKLKNMGYTLVVVSHDDRYFEVADRVVNLNHGIIE